MDTLKFIFYFLFWIPFYPVDPAVLSDTSIERWFEENQAHIEEVIEETRRIRATGVYFGCEDFTGKPGIKRDFATKDWRREKLFVELGKISQLVPGRCFGYKAERGGNSQDGELYSIDFLLMIEGGCIRTGECQPTSLNFVPPESVLKDFQTLETRTRFCHDITLLKARYWYITRQWDREKCFERQKSIQW